VPHKQNLDFTQMLKEPRLLASLNHPNIVTVLTAEKQDNVFFIVMEYVTGETLEHIILREGALDVARALDFTCQICNAVDHAHRRAAVRDAGAVGHRAPDARRASHAAAREEQQDSEGGQRHRAQSAGCRRHAAVSARLGPADRPSRRNVRVAPPGGRRRTEGSQRRRDSVTPSRARDAAGPLLLALPETAPGAHVDMPVLRRIATLTLGACAPPV